MDNAYKQLIFDQLSSDIAADRPTELDLITVLGLCNTDYTPRFGINRWTSYIESHLDVVATAGMSFCDLRCICQFMHRTGAQVGVGGTHYTAGELIRLQREHRLDSTVAALQNLAEGQYTDIGHSDYVIAHYEIDIGYPPTNIYQCDRSVYIRPQNGLWLNCRRCGLSPLIWTFDNGRFTACGCGFSIYNHLSIQAESVSASRRQTGDLRTYDPDRLRVNWNHWVQTSEVLYTPDGLNKSTTDI